MKKAIVIILAVILLAGAAWFWLFRGDDDASQGEHTASLDFPAQFDDSAVASDTTYESQFGSLSFTYPQIWNVTEAADNSEESQLLTIESPLDEHEFYFCLDMYVVADEPETGFAVFDAEVLAADSVTSGQTSVVYRVDGLEGLQWGVSDEPVAVGDTEFTSAITGQSGERMELYGRFNCRDTERADITAEQFQQAHWFQQARGIVESLTF